MTPQVTKAWRYHIGCLRVYLSRLRTENWRDIQASCDKQIDALESALESALSAGEGVIDVTDEGVERACVAYVAARFPGEPSFSEQADKEFQERIRFGIRAALKANLNPQPRKDGEANRPRTESISRLLGQHNSPPLADAEAARASEDAIRARYNGLIRTPRYPHLLPESIVGLIDDVGALLETIVALRRLSPSADLPESIALKQLIPVISEKFAERIADNIARKLGPNPLQGLIHADHRHRLIIEAIEETVTVETQRQHSTADLLKAAKAEQREADVAIAVFHAIRLESGDGYSAACKIAADIRSAGGEG